MSESSLSLTNITIAREIGFMVGYGRDNTSWSSEQKANLEACLDSGYRRFLRPPPINGRVHEWSFVRPVVDFIVWPDAAISAATCSQSGSTTLTASTASFYPSMVGRTITITGQGAKTITAYTSATVVTVSSSATFSGATFSIASAGRFRLADDFGGIESPVTYTNDANRRNKIDVTNESTIREQEQASVVPATPQICAIVPVNSAGTSGQRFDMALWPWPDQVYTLRFRYNAMPGSFASLSSTAYPLGGMNHSETILESCMAVAEERIMDGQGGMHRQNWPVALAGSIDFDLRTMTPEFLGYNRDASDAESVARMQTVYGIPAGFTLADLQ